MDQIDHPRWLTEDLLLKLRDIDRHYSGGMKTKPLVIEIHYYKGNPQVVKLRDQLTPPVLVEMSLTHQIIRHSSGAAATS